MRFLASLEKSEDFVAQALYTFDTQLGGAEKLPLLPLLPFASYSQTDWLIYLPEVMDIAKP